MTSNETPAGPYPVDAPPPPATPAQPGPPPIDIDPSTIAVRSSGKPLRACRNTRKLYPHWHPKAGSYLCGDGLIHAVHSRSRCRRCYQRWYAAEVRRVKERADALAAGEAQAPSDDKIS